MRFHRFINLVLLLILASASSLAASAPNFRIAKLKCLDQCGNVSIPFPFGTTKDCCLHYSFFVSCNRTTNPPKLFMQNTTIEIQNISLDGQVTIMQFIAHDCYTPNGTRDFYNDPSIELAEYLTVNNTANKFTVVGCDSYGLIFGKTPQSREYRTGCFALCHPDDDLGPASSPGLGYCQISLPNYVWNVTLSLSSLNNFTNNNLWEFNHCGYAFVAEENSFSFSPENLTNLKGVEQLPMVVDWAIGNETCNQAQMNPSSYACKSSNSKCYKPENGHGYRCSCQPGYQGNPYLSDPQGCQDINECGDPRLNNCEKGEKLCINTPGAFHCRCPKGHHGDGRRNGRGCFRDDSLALKLVAGIALGVIALIMSAYWLRFEVKRRKLVIMKRRFFSQNGGNLLLKELTARGAREKSDMTKIFSASELQKATNNFNKSTIIGQGAYGIVYKGSFPENVTVAIKKPKAVDRNQIEQFINEVIVLSQINHRNVVKLLGCCLETQDPLLVYEFIKNGTLFEHLHTQARARYITWDRRLKIATETAGVLSYLHSDTSIPIIHRDVKPTNILLDDTYTVKVSDFGTSKLIPLNQVQLCTVVQGTFGYLDPEYMQTSHLNEKSDVYSFGVVLVELLTGMKAFSFVRPENERNLANIFLSQMKQGQECIFELFQDNVVREGNKEELMKVAILAESCLRMRGGERPSMKEVAMELQGLIIVRGKHSWDQTEHKAEDKECLLEEGSTSTDFYSLRDEVIVPVEEGSTSTDFYSLRDEVIVPVGHGR